MRRARSKKLRANSTILDLVLQTVLLVLWEVLSLDLLAIVMRRSRLRSSMILARPSNVVPSTISRSRTHRCASAARIRVYDRSEHHVGGVWWAGWKRCFAGGLGEDTVS